MRIADLPPAALRRVDAAPDARFYAVPRMVAHIDPRAIAAVRALYAERLRPGSQVLDLMSSRYSHLPDMALDVTGLGLNEAELAANPALGRHVVCDLNEAPELPFAAGTFDAVLCCVSVQYLLRPVAVFAEVARVLRGGGAFLATFSNRCFPTKAVALWQALSAPERARYVALAMEEAGLLGAEAVEILPEDGRGDPLWAVTSRAPSD
jgi:SAM-dependent methyltransferase